MSEKLSAMGRARVSRAQGAASPLIAVVVNFRNGLI
jgi:hypothetical protein